VGNSLPTAARRASRITGIPRGGFPERVVEDNFKVNKALGAVETFRCALNSKRGVLVSQQPSLASHLRKKYDQAGSSLFQDANACVALSGIFINIVQDPDLKLTYLVVDALDECVTDLPKLLDFIVYTSLSSARIKEPWKTR
jgi:hypothetical protein